MGPDQDVLEQAPTGSAYRVLGDQAALVHAHCVEVSTTLQMLGDALGVVSAGGAGGGGQEWSGFGLVGLPIMASLRAVKGLASQYVKQQTGTGLAEWTDFVGRAGDQFEGYLARLERVAALARQREQGAGAQDGSGQDGAGTGLTGAGGAGTGVGGPGSAGTSATAESDLGELATARWETQAWKVVLGRVAQLGRVVDAVLQVESDVQAAEAETPQEAAAPSGFGGLQRRIKEVQHRTMDRSTDLRAWVLHPFLDVRDRTRALPQQVDQLARDVGLLELLLELFSAQLVLEDGRLQPGDVEAVRRRVAVCVELPALTTRLLEVRGRVRDLDQWRARLAEAGSAGEVGPGAAALLDADYRQRREAEQAVLEDLTRRAQAWRRDGRRLLASCREWVDLQLAVLDARTVAGEVGLPPERRTLLLREGERLTEAEGLLTVLDGVA